MSNDFDFDFWKREFRDRFDLNRIGTEILSNFIHCNPSVAKNYIIDTYSQKVDRLELIDNFCDRYDSEKINSILKQIEYEELTKEEILDYDIKETEIQDELEE